MRRFSPNCVTCSTDGWLVLWLIGVENQSGCSKIQYLQRFWQKSIFWKDACNTSLHNLFDMIHQHLTQKQQVRILPQQIQLLNLFHLNTLELEHRSEER